MAQDPSPLGRLLGSGNGQPQCRTIADDISVHWWPAGAPAGTPCYCGETLAKDPEFDVEDAGQPD